MFYHHDARRPPWQFHADEGLNCRFIEVYFGCDKRRLNIIRSARDHGEIDTPPGRLQMAWADARRADAIGVASSDFHASRISCKESFKWHFERHRFRVRSSNALLSSPPVAEASPIRKTNYGVSASVILHGRHAAMLSRYSPLEITNGIARCRRSMFLRWRFK